jgi:hypothetical protein
MHSLERHLISMSDPRHRLLSVFGYDIASLELDDVPDTFTKHVGSLPQSMKASMDSKTMNSASFLASLHACRREQFSTVALILN